MFSFSRICNIKDAIATVHSLDRATDLAECLKTTRKDGRVVKRHSNSIVLRKKLDGEMTNFFLNSYSFSKFLLFLYRILTSGLGLRIKYGFTWCTLRTT